MELLNNILKEIKPTEKENNEILPKIDDILKKINARMSDAKAVLGGSGAKGTWLKGVHDADIFVLFNYEKYKEKSNELSDILEKVLKSIFKNPTRLHGSRDYFQLKMGGFTFEIIPILEIKKAEQAKNITDVSPLHANWVNRYKNLKDEILLTKQFCKANNVYGAESYIKGFSGYVCEILTIYYGSFIGLVKNAARWKDKVIIDIKDYYKNENVLFELNKSKIYSPLIIIDPVQKDRNAAAALSKEKFEVFKEKCKKFFKNPSKKFFEKKVINIKELKKRTKNKKLVILDVRAKRGKEDVIGAKLLKAFKYIKKNLILEGFKIFEHGWEWDKEKNAFFYFILDKKLLSKIKEQTGPPLKAKEHVVLFKKKHKNTFIRKKRIYAKIKRRFRKPEELIKELIKDGYVKGKVKAVRIRCK